MSENEGEAKMVDNPSETVASNQPEQKRSKNTAIAFVLLALVCVVILAILVTHYVKDREVASTNSACSSLASGSIIESATQAFNSNNIKQLNNVVGSIKNLSYYKNNANCMYIVTMYYVDTSNAVQASSSLSSFNNAYTGSNLSTKLVAISPVAELRSSVNRIGVINLQNAQNSEALSPSSGSLGSNK